MNFDHLSLLLATDPAQADRLDDYIAAINDVDTAAVDAAAAQDRRWFADHPGEQTYTRPPIFGEWRAMTPAGHDCIAVQVAQARPGVRFRVPVFAPITPNA